MADRCPFGWWGAHTFQARYDTKFPDRGFKINTFHGAMDDLKERTYVHDICVRCGKVITRDVGGPREP